MGIVRMGPPADLMLGLKQRYELKHFVETGTYYGGTAVWAASHFDRVTTIEYSRVIYEETSARLASIENINFIFGDSRTELRKIIAELTRPAIFWLDSHWSGGETHGENDQCPLVEEIRAINVSHHSHFVFIDDARLFMSPPPRPHRIHQWPSIGEIIETLKSGSHNYYLVVIEDVIVAVPGYAREFVADYCQEVNTRAWLEHGRSVKESTTLRGFKLIDQGLRLVGEGLYVQPKRVGRTLNSLVRKTHT